MSAHLTTVAPVRLHWERSGSGDPVVLSHGLGDDATTAAPVVPLLAGRHTVVTWDQRGHGRSAAPPAPEAYGPDAGIADLLSVIARVEAPVHLVGHSLGGYLSLAVALRRPELVRSLTLLASGPGYRDAGARAAWNRFVDEAALRLPIPAPAVGLARQHDSWVIDHVAELRAPLLVVVGEGDTRFHASAAFLNRAVAGSTLHRVAGAGHHPHATHPDEVAAVLLAHFAQERGQ